MRDAPRNDAGLIGKIILIWLLFLALAVVAVIDTGAILVMRFRAEGAARGAASAGAEAFAATGEEGGARRAAEEAVAVTSDELTLAGFAILDDGRARAVVTGDPTTILAERIAPFVDELAAVVAVRVRAVAAPSAG